MREGTHFVNSDEYSTLAKGEIENILKRDGRSRAVVCVETGKRYESIKAASGSMETDWEAPGRGLAFAVKIPIAPLTANIGAIQMIWSQE